MCISTAAQPSRISAPSWHVHTRDNRCQLLMQSKLYSSLLVVSSVLYPSCLDPCQCSSAACWCAGLVSLTLLEAPLFGPPHAHLQSPTRAHFIGDLSPQSSPAHYTAAVQSLHDWYIEHSAKHLGNGKARPPLVINTHGWIKVFISMPFLQSLLCHPFAVTCLPNQPASQAETSLTHVPTTIRYL